MSGNRSLYRRTNSANWYARFVCNGIEHRVSTKTPNIVEAKAIRDNLIRQARAKLGAPGSIDIGWEDRCNRALVDPGSWLHKMKWTLRRRNRGSFNKGTALDENAIYQLARSTNGVCAVSGLPFHFIGDEPDAGPFAISVDRIRAGQPYSYTNCRFVLRGVNYAMHTWGEDAFWQIAKAAVGQRLMLND